MKRVTNKILSMCLAVMMLSTMFVGLAVPVNASIIDNLNETGTNIYEYIKSEIISIGETGGSCVIYITDDLLNYSELSIDTTKDKVAEAKQQLQKLILEDYQLSKAYLRAKYETLYESYWINYGAPVVINYGVRTKTSGNNTTVFVDPDSLYIKFSIDSRYTEDDNIVIPSNSELLKVVKDNANTIVSSYVGKSDLEKLQGYRDTILKLASYNYEAAKIAKTSEFTVEDAYPWTMFYVFDNSTKTSVVCRGYADAFKYLCDLTTFDHSQIECITVNGDLMTSESSTKHAWNIVHMDDGNNYIVDLTLSDTGGIASTNKIFLAKATGDVTNGYVIKIGNNSIRYKYSKSSSENPVKLFGEEILEISDTDYSPTKISYVDRFTDVNSSDWFYNAVFWAIKNKITIGTTDTTFTPYRDCTKAEILTFLWRAYGSEDMSKEAELNIFKDIKSSDYFYNAAKWALKNDLVEGPNFNPSEPCTRAQVVTYLYKLNLGDYIPNSAPSSKFVDIDKDNYELTQALDWALHNNITNGTSETTFSPDQVCNRAQIVRFIYNAYKQDKLK